jgi:hypothetical protein
MALILLALQLSRKIHFIRACKEKGIILYLIPSEAAMACKSINQTFTLSIIQTPLPIQINIKNK